MMRLYPLIATILLGLSHCAQAVDSDLDGLPDEWELQHFPTLNQAGAFTNADGDPHTDREEFIAGTDPDLASDYFRIRARAAGMRLMARTAALPASGPGYTGLTRTYDYEYRVTTARAASWRPLALSTMQDAGNEWVLDWTPIGDRVRVRAVARLHPPNPAPIPPAKRLEDLDSSASFVVYYGNDFSEAVLQQLATFDVVVLEPSAPDLNPAKIARLQQDGVSLVLGYISIGEDPGAAPLLTGDGSGPVSFSNTVLSASNNVASFYVDQAWDGSTYVSDGLPDMNGAFGSRFVWPNAEWRQVLKDQRIGGTTELPGRSLAGLDQIADRRINDYTSDRTTAFGFDGFFLDTLDTAGPFDGVAGFYPWAAEAMRDTVKFIHETYPGKVLMANRGIFFHNPAVVNTRLGIRAHDFTVRPYVHALLVESYTLDSNPSEPGLSPFFGDNKHNYAQKIIAEANRPDGFTVFCLDYQQGRGDALVDRAVSESVASNGWVHYLAPDGGLDTIGSYASALLNRPDIQPPVWDSTGSPGFSPTDVPDRIGVQEVIPGPGLDEITVRWDVARDRSLPIRYHILIDTDPAFVAPTTYENVAFDTGEGWSTDPTSAFACEMVLGGLDAGTHYVRVRAADNRGQVETNTVTLSVELAPPPFSNPVPSITLDGDLADWLTTTSFGSDPDDVTGASNPVDWLEAGCAHSPTNLFLFVRTDGPAPLGIGYNLFFDTDTNRATGFRGGGDSFPLGAEYLLQGGGLFAYSGTGTDWSWSFIAGAASASADANVEWSIPFTSLGDPSTLDVFYYGDNPALGGDTLDVFPDTALMTGGGGEAFRYTR